MTFWTEPHNGVDFGNETLTPAAVNTMNTNTKNAVLAAIRNANSCQLAGIRFSSGAHWSPSLKCWVTINETDGRIAACAPSGAYLNFGTAVLTNYLASDGEYPGIAFTSQDAAVRIYALPQSPTNNASADTNIYYSTDFGATWQVGATGANINHAYFDSPPVWLGGANAVFVAGAGFIDGMPRVLVYSAGVFSIVALPGATTAAMLPSIATNGSGQVVYVGDYDKKVYVGTNYGTLAGYWSQNDLPGDWQVGGPFWTATPTVAFDSVRSVYVVVCRGHATEAAQIKLTTSSDGTTWQPWRVVPYTCDTTQSGRKISIKCVGGIWFIRTIKNASGLFSSRVIFSIDAGASWYDAGIYGSSTTTDDYNYYSFDTDGSRILTLTQSEPYATPIRPVIATNFGPFDEITPLPSTVL